LRVPFPTESMPGKLTEDSRGWLPPTGLYCVRKATPVRVISVRLVEWPILLRLAPTEEESKRDGGNKPFTLLENKQITPVPFYGSGAERLGRCDRYITFAGGHASSNGDFPERMTEPRFRGTANNSETIERTTMFAG